MATPPRPRVTPGPAGNSIGDGHIEDIYPGLQRDLVPLSGLRNNAEANYTRGRSFGSAAGTIGEHIFYDLLGDSPRSVTDSGFGSEPADLGRIGQKNDDDEYNPDAPQRSTDQSTIGSDVELIQQRPPAVDPSRLEQMQMLSDFLEMHFPTPAAKANMTYRRSYLAGLPEIDISSSPMLKNAVDAICYAHAGSNYKDRRLVQQSQRSYGKVLSALVRTLEHSGHKSDPRILIPSIMLLCLYDDSIPSSNQHSTGWRAHYGGVHEYLRACGPTCFNMSAPFERLVFLNLRSPTMFLGLARRKSVVLSEPQWQALSDRTSTSIKSVAELNRRAMQLPGLLEKSDMLVRKRAIDQEQFMNDLLSLRAEFLQWSIYESSFADKTMKNHDIVTIEDLEAFDMNIEEHVVLTLNNIFTQHFDFVSYRIAEDMTLYWMFCLILDCTLLRILHFRPKARQYIATRKYEDILRDAHIRARYVCRSVYFISKFNSQGITAFMDTLMSLAENFFSETEAVRELGWCQAIRCATKLCVQRLRTFQAKTLCRMGDMADELGAAAKFHSRPV